MTQTRDTQDGRAALARWLFLAACGVAGAVVVVTARVGDPPIASAVPPPSGLITAPAPDVPDGLLSRPLDEARRQLTPSADEPLHTAPGGVAPPPRARTLLASQRGEGPWIEQQAVYRIDPDADEERADTQVLGDRVLEHYEAAAVASGYTVRPTAGGGPMSRLFIADRRTLLVRVRVMDDHVTAAVLSRATVQSP